MTEAGALRSGPLLSLSLDRPVLLVVLQDLVRLRAGVLHRLVDVADLPCGHRGEQVLDDGPDVLLAADVGLRLARPVQVEGLLPLGVILRPTNP